MVSRGAILADNNIQQKIEKHLKHLFVHYIKSEDESGAIDYINNLSERYSENMPLLLNALLFTMDINNITIRVPLVYIATVSNYARLIKVIARLGADINFKIEHNSYTPVRLACGANKPASLAALLEAGAVINSKIGSSRHIITYASHVDLLRELIQYGSKHNSLEEIFGSKVGNNALFEHACRKDKFELVNMLLSNAYFRKYSSIEMILHYLHFAAWKSLTNRSYYEKLYAELGGSRLHSSLLDDEINNTIMKDDLCYLYNHYLKKNNEEGALEFLDYLSSRYLDRFQKLLNLLYFETKVSNKMIKVPLIYIACIHNLFKLIKKINELGGDINLCVQDLNVTPLMYACLTNKLMCITTLIECGADMKVTQTISGYAMVFCVRNPTLLRELIDYSLKNNCINRLFSDKRSNDALFNHVCNENEIALIEELLAIPFYKNNLTPLKVLYTVENAAYQHKVNERYYTELRDKLNTEFLDHTHLGDQDRLECMQDDLRFLVEHYYQKSDEEGAVEYIKHLVSRYTTHFPQFLNTLYLVTHLNQVEEKTSLIFSAINHSCNNVIEQISELGANLNLRIGSLGITPLMYACALKNHTAVATLLKLGAGINVKSNLNYTVIFYAKTKEVCDELIRYATANRCFDQLFSDKSSNHQFFMNVCENDNIELIDFLLNSTLFRMKSSNKKILGNLRFAAWNHANNRLLYEKKCFDISSQVSTYTLPACDLTRNMTDKDDEDFQRLYLYNYNSIFKSFLSKYQASKSYFLIKKNKIETLKSVLMQIAVYMQQPKRCFGFLSQLNSELVDYIQHVHGRAPEVLSESTQECMINDVMYKFPLNTSYKGLQKRHALQEVMISILKNRGLANKMYKWVGHVPGRYAKKMLQNGDFITEDRMGIGVLHGKLSHMIHIILCIYILESDQVNTSYLNDDGSESKLTIQDILDAMFFLHDESDSKHVSLFKAIFDRRIFNFVAFGDPHRLISFIMCQGGRIGLTALSDYTSDSFMKGIISLLEVHNRYLEPNNQLSLAKFAAQLSQTRIHFFNNPQFVTNESFKRVNDKYPVEKIVESGDGFKVVEKDYEWNQDFKPRKFKS